MKKIFSGFCYRFLKGYELWALIILTVLSSVYLNHVNMKGSYAALKINGETAFIGAENNIAINRDNLDQYNFAGSGISAKDIYRSFLEPIPQETFDKINMSPSIIDSEETLVDNALNETFLFPAFLMLIFIPLFFGRLFSDGTVKNLIASGHSKRSIYLSSLIMTFCLDIMLFIINILIFVAFCLFYQWKPPLYYPLIISVLLIKLLIFFTSASLILAVLFISKKKTLTLIIGSVLFFGFFFRIPNPAISGLQTYVDAADGSAEDEYLAIVREKGINVFDSKLDLTVYSKRFYYEDKEVLPYRCTLPDPSRYILLAMIYLDPALISHNDYVVPVYLLYRDGPLAINAVCDICWIMISCFAGMVIFNKREII